ncbi:unnamed protein product, partial [Symbiodinium sp. KB8]
MAPTRKDGPQKSKGKGANTVEESQREALHFGYPQPLVAALQAIAARSTAGLFKDPVAVAADRTAQQLAQSQANILDRLGKRLSGNAKAKTALRDAANAWIGKLGQHLVALSARLQNVAERLDSDQNEAIAELQTATMNLGVGAGDQVTQALGSLGTVWTPMQEDEILRLATALRAFSSVGPGTSGSHGGIILAPSLTGFPGTALTEGPCMDGLAAHQVLVNPIVPGHASASSTPARSSTSGENMDTSGADTTAKRRWNQRGNRHPRPSKSPRRELDLSSEPWTKAATGLTPERPGRATAPDDEELIPAVSTTPLTWMTAWFQVSRQCWEHGSAVVGQLVASECQERVIPLQHLVADPAAVVAEGEEIWALLSHAVQQLESESEVLQLVERLRIWLGTCRECPSAVPQARQGLLLLAHATQGNLYNIDATGPSTAQEWLYPAELLGQDIPLTGILSATWDSLALRVLSTMPMQYGIFMLHSRFHFCWDHFWLSSRLCFVFLPLASGSDTGEIPEPLDRAISVLDFFPLSFAHRVAGPVRSIPQRRQNMTYARRQLAVFFGRPASEPPLLPCPITMLADERLHGTTLHHRIALNLGSDGVDARVVQLQSPLPGLPAEQLLFLPRDVGWNAIVLPVDLRPLGGSVCLVRCERSDTCGQVLAAALEHQGRFRALQGVLGRCSLGWFSLGSQPLILPNVDALQFAHGPEPSQVQPLFGASLEPPFTLDTLMQVSATPAGPPVELFSGFSANHAVLFTPNGLVYVEVPVFADANTYRRLVALQASPTADGIMRVWQPTGWRIVTTCVEPPVSPLRALETAIDDGRDLPSDWPTTCRAGGFGILHKEIAVSATQPLPGGPPFVLLFFPHIFTHDDISSEGAVGGYEAWDHSVRVADTLPPLLPGQVGSSPSMPSLHDWAPLPARTSGTENSPAYDIVEDVTHAASSLPAHPASDASRTGATKLGRFLGGLFLSFQTSPRVVIGLCLCHVALAMTTQSEPSSPRFVVEAPRPALDAARLAPPPAHQRLQTLWQHGAFEFDGPLWPVPSSGSQQLRFSFKLWGPEDTHILVFLGTQSAREVRTELLRIAGLSGRPRIFSASHGLSVAHVHLVMASTTAALATVLLDAGLEVWCADIPRHASPSQLLALACDLAATDALQVNTEIMPPFRHGDVLPVRLEADHLRVDLTRQILARPDLSASRWLDPVQSFYMLTHSHGLQGFQVAVGAEVTLNLLHSLLPPQERLGGSFLELPARANFPHRVFVHCGRGRDHVVFRVSEASDPSDSGFLFLFAGDFDTYADFARLLGKLQTPAARWLRALRPYGLIVSTWVTRLGPFVMVIGFGVVALLWLPMALSVNLEASITDASADHEPVRPRRLALHLPGFLRALGYTEGVDSLHVAFDTGAAGDSIMHLLFDRASVVYGHHPFDWDIAAAHIRELYQGIPVPSSRPTLVIGSQRIPPSCHLTDVPSGSIIQIPLGALPMEASHDVWDPTPWVLPGPFFQYAPARGPAGEEAISPAQGEVIDSVTQVPATREIACQTDSSYAVDHRLLSAPVVEGLVLQLQGVADCLLSLPFTELGEPTRPPPSSSSSQPAVPVFSGPPLENLSAVETSITVLVAEQDAENSHVSPGVTSPPASTAPRVSRPTSLWCILSLALLGSRDGIRITPGTSPNQQGPFRRDTVLGSGIKNLSISPRLASYKPMLITEVAQDTVTFRSGDCFRVDTTADHTPASEFARLEASSPVDRRDRRQEPLEFEGSWDIQTSGTGQHAPWAVGFRLDSDTDVDLLRPGQRPTPATVPAGETWAPVQCTFSGDFNLQYPGMWTPVQWTASSTNTLGSLNERLTRVDETWKPLLPAAVPSGPKLPTLYTPHLFPGRSSWPGCRAARYQLPILLLLPPLPRRPEGARALKGLYEQCVRHLAATWQDGHHASSENLAVCVSAPDVDTSLCVARVRLLCRILQGRSSFVYEAFAASWDRAGRFAVLLQRAVRELWPATDLPPLDVGGPTLALVARSSRALLQACRRISRHGTMLKALCHMWCSFRAGRPKAVIGAALPQTCQLCQAVLPSQHALAAHLHRMHGQVALSTQYTCGTSCLWCLLEFHNSARLRYHLQHSSPCEHGLRCVVGPVYVYGSGTKRSGKKGHLRAPIFRIAGPINATPAQRRASLDGRVCSQAELDEELQRLAPGPGFATSARSATVVPRPNPLSAEPPNATASPPGPVLLTGNTSSPSEHSWSWGAFSEFACSDDGLVASLRWDAPQPARVWAVPLEWYRCLRAFIQLSLNEPWSPATWRAVAFLRREAAPRSLDAKSSTFADATQIRQLFLRRLVTFRWLLSGLGSEHALWFRAPLAPALHAFLLH